MQWWNGHGARFDSASTLRIEAGLGLLGGGVGCAPTLLGGYPTRRPSTCWAILKQAVPVIPVA